MPYNDYFEYYGPEYRLHMPVSNMENLNDREYLSKVKVGSIDVVEPKRIFCWRAQIFVFFYCTIASISVNFSSN